MGTSGSDVCRPSNRNFPAASITASAVASNTATSGGTGGLRAQTMRKPTGINDSSLADLPLPRAASMDLVADGDPTLPPDSWEIRGEVLGQPDPAPGVDAHL